jgi:type II pantothenate kinase
MIFQTIGMLAVFVSKCDRIKTFVMTGTLTTLPQAKGIFDAIGQMHGIELVVPRNAIYATAIGATLSHMKNGR